jgi:Tfp pilus assembly PilM family ATPase
MSDTFAETHFQTEVLLGDPFGKTEAPAFLEKVLRETGPEFAVSVGIALRKLQELQ